MASPTLPDPETITFADVITNHWDLTGNCEACRALRPFRASLSSDLAQRRVGDAWRAGKLVCSKHRTPLDGIEIKAGGNMTVGFVIAGRWFQPGRWPDPAYAERMRPVWEENARRIREGR